MFGGYSSMFGRSPRDSRRGSEVYWGFRALGFGSIGFKEDSS